MFLRTSCADKARRTGTPSHRPRLAGGSSVTSSPSIRIVAGGQILQPRDQAQQRGLSAARGADEDDELAIVDVEVDAGDDDDIAEGLADVLEGDLCP